MHILSNPKKLKIKNLLILFLIFHKNLIINVFWYFYLNQIY